MKMSVSVSLIKEVIFNAVRVNSAASRRGSRRKAGGSHRLDPVRPSKVSTRLVKRPADGRYASTTT
jgi:hypothetical protein